MKEAALIQIRRHVEGILECIEPDTFKREGLKDTPTRVAKMYAELFHGYDSPPPVVTTFNNGSDGIIYDQMITDQGPFNSSCEHHCVPFYGTYYFAYVPAELGQLLGLSKVARVVDYFSARLQVQERLVQQVLNHLWDQLRGVDVPSAPLGMALIMQGTHLCKKMRGVKKDGVMTTSAIRGVFRNNPVAMNEFLKLVGLKGDF